ncbi:MAG: hypothetical protein R3F53_12525 [Gammaproteobacteria bacterium]
MPDSIQIIQLVIYGLVYGSVVALGAVGVSLTFGVLRFANFAHGDLMTFGAYIVLLLYSMLQLPLWLGLLCALLATAALALFIDAVLYQRLRRLNPRNSSMILLISSFGVGLMLRSLIQLLWGPDTQVYDRVSSYL